MSRHPRRISRARSAPTSPSALSYARTQMSASTYKIRLLDPPALFEARAGESLLEAAERSGVALQSSCRNGTCRTCMRKLVAGSVDYRVAWPGLNPQERDEGWVLPCVAVPASDVVLGEPAQPGWWAG
jgi:ferredoxin